MRCGAGGGGGGGAHRPVTVLAPPQAGRIRVSRRFKFHKTEGRRDPASGGGESLSPSFGVDLVIKIIVDISPGLPSTKIDATRS